MATGLALWQRYRADLVRRRRSARTIEANRHILLDFFAFLAPKSPLRMAPDDLERYLRRPSKGRGRRAAPSLSDATRAAYANRITTFSRWLFTEGVTPSDRLARFVTPRQPVPLPRALERDDLAMLFEHAEHLAHDHTVTTATDNGRREEHLVSGDPRLHLLAWLAYGAGLRVGEISRLRIEHVQLRGPDPRMTVHGKGGKRRVVPLAPPLVAELSVWLADRPRTGWVIPNLVRQGDGVAPQTVSRLLAHLAHSAGLNDTGHALRHSFATELLAKGRGTNLRAVSRLLGHATTAVTELVYTASYDADTREAVGLLPIPGT